MKGGLIFFGLLIVVAIAAIAGLLYRPATVIGVSDKSLAYSVRGAAETNETGRCQGRDDEYVCTAVPDEGATAAYAVSIGDYGCWDAKRREDTGTDFPATLEGCITIFDLIRLDD